jgi:fructoselysine and glucoselysine-specific PTS system IIB component
MIVLVRVDDRLVHSRVLEAWVPFFKADYIILASDEIAKDQFRRQVIESCTYSNLLVKVENVKDAVQEICSGGLDTYRIIVIVGSLKDAMKLYNGGVKISSVNIGNIHHRGNTKMITSSVYINKEDENIIEKFREIGIPLEIRAIPFDKPLEFYSCTAKD